MLPPNPRATVLFTPMRRVEERPHRRHTISLRAPKGAPDFIPRVQPDGTLRGLAGRPGRTHVEHVLPPGGVDWAQSLAPQAQGVPGLPQVPARYGASAGVRQDEQHRRFTRANTPANTELGMMMLMLRKLGQRVNEGTALELAQSAHDWADRHGVRYDHDGGDAAIMRAMMLATGVKSARDLQGLSGLADGAGDFISALSKTATDLWGSVSGQTAQQNAQQNALALAKLQQDAALKEAEARAATWTKITPWLAVAGAALGGFIVLEAVKARRK